MNDAFKIYVDQLRDGSEEEIYETLPSSFIGVHENDLSFVDPVLLRGRAYLADDSLILHLDIEAYALVPCTICNALVRVAVQIHNFYHAELLKEIKSGIYHMESLLRETILLETPKFAECNQGQCSEREKVSRYLKSSSDETGIEDGDEGYRPFSNLELK